MVETFPWQFSKIYCSDQYFCFDSNVITLQSMDSNMIISLSINSNTVRTNSNVNFKDLLIS